MFFPPRTSAARRGTGRRHAAPGPDGAGRGSARGGFTLLEVVVSITVLGVVSSVCLTGIVHAVGVYRSALRQAERVPAVEAAHAFIAGRLRSGTDPSMPGRFTLGESGMLKFDGNDLLGGVTAFSISEHAVSESGAAGTVAMGQGGSGVKSVDDEQDRRYYRLHLAAGISEGAAMELDTDVLPETGVLREHWGREYMK